MKSIAITPRVNISEHGERFEAVASQWGSWLADLNTSLLPLTYTPALLQTQLSDMKPDVVILSGGNDIASLPQAQNAAPERDAGERVVIDWAVRNKRPILGICRGMQMLNMYFGGTLAHVENHAGTRHMVDFSPLGKHIEVNSYHNWGIEPQGLSKEMQPLAVDASGHIEAMKHISLPILGIMWHPERESTDKHPADPFLKDFLKQAL